VRHKVLGRTGIRVPIVGIGTAFIGYQPRTGWEDAGELSISEPVAEATVFAALEAGATFVDTAPLYGQTRVESVVGRVLARFGAGEELVLGTKAGRDAEGHDYSRDAILRSVEGSLRRLGVDRLDVVSVHDSMDYFDDVMGPEGALGALRELRDQGVIRAVGVGCADPDETARYVETGEFDVAIVANAWSLVNRRMEERIIPAALRFDTGIVVATPLERGLLAVGTGGGHVQGGREHSEDVIRLVARVEDLCERYDVSLLAVSLQWLTRHPQVASAIPGPRTADEAVANTRAASVDIPDELWRELDAITIKVPQ
jgi:D-threo-aldose 1-dehydrogenase